MLALTRPSEVLRPGSWAAQGEADAPPSFLGPGVGVEGALEIPGELVVSGLVKGRIAAFRLVIAAKGYVEGDVVAHHGRARRPRGRPHAVAAHQLF